MLHNGKEVFTVDSSTYENAKVGDYVKQAVVDNAINCLPPASMTSMCSQLGEPYSTFKRVAGDGPNGIWEYCGHCFRGENTERGRDPVYC